MKTLALPHIDKVTEVMRRNNINFSAVFGSHAKGTAKKNSDYDILVQFSPNSQVGLFKYQAIEDELSHILGKKVDLVTVNGIDRHIKDEVFQTMSVIYGEKPKG